jgi:hypothetical protein
MLALMSKTERRRPPPVGRTEATWSTAAVRRFLATFAVAVVLLLAPWPRWGRAFSHLFSGYANFVVDAFVLEDEAMARFRPPTPEDRRRSDVKEWSVMLSAKDAGETVLDTRILGYTPLAVFAALVLATPVDRRRKVKILFGGGAVVLARLACAIALPVARALGAQGPSWAFGTVAEVSWWAFISPPAMSYVTGAFGWWIAFALTSRRGAAAGISRGGGRRASARTPASNRDRDRTSTEARA